jgi:hypothetical protein
MPSKVQMRRDTYANWAAANPVLSAGEWAMETDTGLLKVGNGTSAYNALAYEGPDFHRLTGNGSAIGPAIADFFPTAAYSLPASSATEFEWDLYFTKTTAGTVTFTLTSTVGVTNVVAHYYGGPVAGIQAAGAMISAGVIAGSGTAVALPATTSLTTAVNHNFVIKALVETTSATATRLQITSSAGTVTPLRGSWIKTRRLPVANYGVFA